MTVKCEERIGVNIASMLPWAAVPVIGLWIAGWISEKAGFSFWQVLPIRSVSVPALKKLHVSIRYVEPAWNATTLLGHLRGRLGSENMPTMWQDVLFFPNPAVCSKVFREVASLGVTFITHHVESGSLVEFHPGLGISATELVRRAYGPGGVVIDTRHIRRTEAGDLRPANEYGADFAALLPLSVLIHVQAWDAREWKRFAEGKRTNLEAMLKYAVQHGFLGDFVVEYRPGAIGGILEIVFPWILAKSLRSVRCRIDEIMGLFE